MKKILVCLLGMLMVCSNSDVVAQAITYIPDSLIPRPYTWVPGPPEATSMRFANDMQSYQWHVIQRQKAPERMQEAVDDTVYFAHEIIARFSDAFGMELSEANTPEICKLYALSIASTNKVNSAVKRHFRRTRPFVFFNDTTLTPRSEPAMIASSSYPSGHTSRAFVAAILLAEINPACADKIFDVGYQMGVSRQYVGAHWQSDVEDSRLVAVESCAILHSSEAFQEQMAKAKAEFAWLKAEKHQVSDKANVKVHPNYNGTAIQNGRKPAVVN